MKAVEKKMISAIKKKKNMTQGNTKVKCEGDNISVSLFGNTIFSIFSTFVDGKEGTVIEINDCGYRTATTKSRLNALLSEFSGGYIYQYKYDWYFKQPNENKVEPWEGCYYVVS